MDKVAARRAMNLSPILNFQNIFIVGSVNRNQPRKRWDLLIKYFATWVKEYDIDDAYLFLHTAPTGEEGIDVKQLSAYYGILSKIILVTPATWYGPDDSVMRETYNCFDVAASTTQGEGMGLTTLEAMACGIPSIAPDWAALGEWGKGAMQLIPCTSTAIGPPYLNVIGGIADEELFIKALDNLYVSREEQKKWSKVALAKTEEDQFRWNTVGRRVSEEIGKVLGAPVKQEVAVG
jgi:glycosyltransferase involved in cell wall biosynthesis